MKSSDYIIKFFVDRGVDTIFGYIGGMITHLVDSADKNPNVRFVQTYHEQSAAMAAEGYAIESGKLGVAMSTSGPGATNMITGIADAYFDSIPVVYITGQVNSYEYKYDKPIRQQGFQETDIVAMVRPITKYAVLVDHIDDLRYELEKAVYIANSGRKGPVVIDLPMNIQRQEINPETMRSFEAPFHDTTFQFDIRETEESLCKAERPMLLLGGGCQHPIVMAELDKFIQTTQIPVVTSLMGRGVIDETYPHYVGMVGSYGNRCANMAIANVDVLLVLGSRLDTRQTGAVIDSFLPNAKIIHVDIDNNELECHRINRQIKIHAEVFDFLQVLNKSNIQTGDFSPWKEYLKDLKINYNQDKEVERFVENKMPYHCMNYINRMMKEGDIVTTDVGQNQMWAAQTIQLKKGQKYLTSGGLAPMGYAMPSAIGCAFANPSKNVYSITGDGGFHMAIQSLPLMSQYGLNIKLCVLNNDALGMITQFQHLYFDNRMAGTVPAGGYMAPNIKVLAEAYGMKYFLVDKNNINNEELYSQIESTQTCLIEMKMEGLTTVCPKLEYNKPISMPIPLLDEDEYKRAMDIKICFELS